MPLKVIGAGFGRTGTASLKFALEQIGYGPCYHMMEVFRLNTVADWDRVFDGVEADWEKIFSGFSSTVDWPSTAIWRELADAYPQTKIILTVRDPVIWWESTQATIFAGMDQPPSSPFEVMSRKMLSRDFERRLSDKAYMVEAFERHNAMVRAEVPAERLLVYDVAEGWAPLCAFLNVPTPEGPMPKVNSREEFAARVRSAGPH